MNRHRALACCLSMISAQTRSADVVMGNRFTRFRIMLEGVLRLQDIATRPQVSSSAMPGSPFSIARR
jgi:hypothetical protein